MWEAGKRADVFSGIWQDYEWGLWAPFPSLNNKPSMKYFICIQIYLSIALLKTLFQCHQSNDLINTKPLCHRPNLIGILYWRTHQSTLAVHICAPSLWHPPSAIYRHICIPVDLHCHLGTCLSHLHHDLRTAWSRGSALDNFWHSALWKLVVLQLAWVDWH